MKLLYIQNNLGQGGISTVSATKQNFLVGKGYKVANVFTHFSPAPEIDNLYNNNITKFTISYTSRKNILSIPIIGRFVWSFYFRIAYLVILLKYNPEIIISTYDHLEPTSIIFLTFWKKRILEFHGMPLNEKISIADWWKYHVKYRFYTIVTLTEGDKKDKDRVSGCNAIVIPNPLTIKNPCFSTCEHKRIIIPARFTEQKGIIPFLPYWKVIEQKHPDWEFHIFGEGPQEKTIFDIKEKNNLKNLFIHKFSSNIKKEIAESSILILPSMFEGFPTTLVEAMTCGVPCVAFDCKYGPSDIIKDGEDGFVVEFKNYEQFVERINTLIENENLRKAMGEKARINIQRYDINTVMKKWEDLFNNI